MNIASIGIDLGKNTFHLVALDSHGKVVIRKRFSRKQLLAYTANLRQFLIGIQACSGAHFSGAALRDQGRRPGVKVSKRYATALFFQRVRCFPATRLKVATLTLRASLPSRGGGG